MSVAVRVPVVERFRQTLPVIVTGGLMTLNLLVTEHEPTAASGGCPTAMIQKPFGKPIRIGATTNSFSYRPSNEILRSSCHRLWLRSFANQPVYFSQNIVDGVEKVAVLHRRLSPLISMRCYGIRLFPQNVRFPGHRRRIRKFGHQHDRTNLRPPDGNRRNPDGRPQPSRSPEVQSKVSGKRRKFASLHARAER